MESLYDQCAPNDLATDTIPKVYPIRWQIELIVKSWKSDLHFASINSKNEVTTLCDLYSRLLFMVLTYAFCPPIRENLWVKKQRELSLRTCMRHFQALAESWMKIIVQSEMELRCFLTRACKTAERLVAKASRKRQTTALQLRESLRIQHESVEFLAVINA